jgi:serine/threonine protein kinase
VLVGDDGRVRIADFGLASARAVTQGAAGDDGGSAAHSSGEWPAALGSLVGTPRYVAPEQLGGEAVDARADQFAFAAALWDALCGQPPFEGDDLITLLANVREGRLSEPPPGELPGWLRAVIARALSAEPGDRFPSMSDLIAALEADPGSERWASRAA